MMNDNKEIKKEEIEEIEVVIGDDSILNISEVGDCMNDLRPKDSVKKRKNFIIITTWWSPRRFGGYGGGSRPFVGASSCTLALGGCPSGL